MATLEINGNIGDANGKSRPYLKTIRIWDINGNTENQ